MKNEIKKDKNDKEFKGRGTVKEILGRNTYKVLSEKGKEFARHISQLRAIEYSNV